MRALKLIVIFCLFPLPVFSDAPTSISEAGIFQLGSQQGFDYVVSDYAVGDIDLDGDNDVAFSSNGVFIYINKGLGEYAMRERIPLNNDNVTNVSLADVDLDGDLDLIAARNGSPIEIFWNDGTGEFEDDSYLFTAEPNRSRQMFVTDVNHDNAPDIITSSPQRISLFLNDGKGSFPTQSLPLVGKDGYIKRQTLADIDRDGHLDVIAVMERQTALDRLSSGSVNEIEFYIGNGQGEFKRDQNLSVRTASVDRFFVADMDSNGSLDILLIGYKQVNLLLNKGNGEFTQSPSGMDIAPNDIATAAVEDVDGDGDMDLIVSYKRAKNVLYLNDGTGRFIPNDSPLGGGTDQYTDHVLIVDVDGDHDMDVLMKSVMNISLYKNMLAQPDIKVQQASTHSLQSSQAQHRQAVFPSFATARTIVNQRGIKHLALADVDSDGHSDLVTVAPDSNLSQLVTVYHNNTDKGLEAYNALKGGEREEVKDVEFADIDNDGDQDMLLGWWNNYDTIHHNDGRGMFESAGLALPASDIYTQKLVTGDVNNDGFSDIVAVGKVRSEVYLNDKSQPLAKHFTVMGNDPSIDGALGDIDNDGDQDLILGHHDIFAYRNNGDGSFEEENSRQHIASVHTQQILLSDIDNDDDLDLLVYGHAYINDGQGRFSHTEDVYTLKYTALGDIDLDGDLDIVTYEPLVPPKVLLNNGKGGWIPSGRPIINGVAKQLLLVDFDGDQDLDILTVQESGDNVILYENLTIKPNVSEHPTVHIDTPVTTESEGSNAMGKSLWGEASDAILARFSFVQILVAAYLVLLVLILVRQKRKKTL